MTKCLHCPEEELVQMNAIKKGDKVKYICPECDCEFVRKNGKLEVTYKDGECTHDSW